MKTILIVEDNPLDIELTKEVIEFCNQNSNTFLYNNFMFATNSKETHDFIKSNYPSLIMLDLKLGKESGKDILKKIKEEEKTKHIPVIIFSNSDAENDINDCYNLNVNSYIKKPVSYEDFIGIILKIKAYWIDANILPSKGIR